MEKKMFKILLFGVDGCPDCEQQKKILSENFNEDWSYIDFDSRIESDQALIAQYDITKPPTLLVIKQSNDGKNRVFRHVGMLSSNKIREFVYDF